MNADRVPRLPPGWTQATIDALVPADGVFIDGDWVESKDQDASGGVRLIQLADVGDGAFINKSNRHLTKKKAYELGCTFLNKGDMLVARMPDPLGRCCIFPLGGEGCFVTVVDVCVIRLSSATTTPKYLMNLLNSPLIRAEISDRQSGSTRKRISRGNLAKIGLPIAPLSEQRRIVAKIEELFSELDKGVELMAAAREQLKVYRQSVLKHAFEGKLTEGWRNVNSQHQDLSAAIQADREARYEKGRRLPRINLKRHQSSLDPQVPPTWEKEYLGNLNVDVFDGPFGSHLKTSDYVGRGIRVLRLENIGYGCFIDEKQSFVSEAKYQEIKRHTVVPGDIVFSSFVTDAIRSALVPSHITFAVNKADCFGVRFLGTTINQKFVQLFFNSRNAFKQVESMIHGVGRPRINTLQLKEIIVPICSRNEQDLIVERVESAFSEIDALEAAIDGDLLRLASLRQSILKSAFSGRLVAQDPQDEPAAVLLERIKAGKQQPENRQKKNGRKKNGEKKAA